jgi:hypothetical protein
MDLPTAFATAPHGSCNSFASLRAPDGALPLCWNFSLASFMETKYAAVYTSTCGSTGGAEDLPPIGTQRCGSSNLRLLGKAALELSLLLRSACALHWPRPPSSSSSGAYWYCLLPIAYCLLPIACIAYIAYCLLPIAYIAYCLLSIVYCLFPACCKSGPKGRAAGASRLASRGPRTRAPARGMHPAWGSGTQPKICLMGI